MRLIAENEMGNVSLIKESLNESGDKELYIEGIFAQAEKKNRNKRTYPKKVLESAVARYIDEYVSKKRAMGELNHPQSPSVNPERACILTTSLEWDGNNVMGRAKVLKTSMGDLVRNLISDGVQLGVSTRGLGSITEKNGESIVEGDYLINAIDVVSNPSGIDCWVDGVLEHMEYYYDKGVLVESTIEEYQKRRRIGSIKDITEDFAKFVRNLVI